MSGQGARIEKINEHVYAIENKVIGLPAGHSELGKFTPKELDALCDIDIEDMKFVFDQKPDMFKFLNG